LRRAFHKAFRKFQSGGKKRSKDFKIFPKISIYFLESRLINGLQANAGKKYLPTYASRDGRHRGRSAAIQGNMGRPTPPWIAAPPKPV
jgi:hypothetical protein